MSATPAESEAARRQRIAAELAAHEAAHPDMIPGTARHFGRQAEGGRYYADLARMAVCRKPSDRTDADWIALGLHPEPTGWVGS